MSALLISGASGYLGHRLTKHLVQQQNVQKLIGLDIREPPVPVSGVHFIQADLRHPSLPKIMKTNEVDTVLHLAFARPPQQDVSTAHDMNVIGTMKLLNACAVAGVKKIIVASCALVYGARYDNPNYITEDSPLLGSRHYFFSGDKIEIENICFQFKTRHPDMCLILVRCSPLLGRDDESALAQLFKRSLVPLIIGFNPLIQLLHVDDCLAACDLFLNYERSDIFNVAGHGTIPLRKAIRLSGGIPVPFPAVFLHPLTELFWHLKVSETPVEYLSYLKYQCTISTQKMKQYFNFQPYYSSEETLRDFVASQRTARIEHSERQPQKHQLTMLADSGSDFDDLN